MQLKPGGKNHAGTGVRGKEKESPLVRGSSSLIASASLWSSVYRARGARGGEALIVFHISEPPRRLAFHRDKWEFTYVFENNCLSLARARVLPSSFPLLCLWLSCLAPLSSALYQLVPQPCAWESCAELFHSRQSSFALRASWSNDCVCSGERLNKWR